MSNIFNTKNLVSYPRSGQYMTESALKYYCQLLNIPFLYCEFYSCCQSRPCRKSPFAFQKSHDFELNDPIMDNNKYIFLYRSNLLQQLESHFRFHAKYGLKIHNDTNEKIDYTDVTMLEYFEDFVKTNKNYYINMCNKYKNKNRHNVLEVEYEYYVNNFNEMFRKILSFFDIDINDEYIEKTKIFIKPELVLKIDKSDSYYSYLEKYVTTI